MIHEIRLKTGEIIKQENVISITPGKGITKETLHIPMLYIKVIDVGPEGFLEYSVATSEVLTIEPKEKHNKKLIYLFNRFIAVLRDDKECIGELSKQIDLAHVEQFKRVKSKNYDKSNTIKKILKISHKKQKSVLIKLREIQKILR